MRQFGANGLSPSRITGNRTSKLRPGELLVALRSPLLTSTMYLLLSAGSGLVLGSGFWFVVARLYSPASIGLASAAASSLMLLATLGDLGLDYALMRFGPGEPERVQRIANLSFTVTGGLTLVGAVVFVAGLSVWSPALLKINDLQLFVIVFVVAAPGFTLSNLVDATLISQRASRLVLVKNLAANAVRFPIAAIMLGLSAAGLFLGISFSMAGVAVLSILLLRKVLPGYRFRPSVDIGLLREMLPYGLKNHLVNILSSLPILLLPTLVLNKLGPLNSGYFAIAWLFITPIFMVLASVSSALLSEGGREDVRYVDEVRRGLGFVLPIFIALVGCGSILAHPLLSLFGSSYADAATNLLRLLLFSTIPGAINSIFQARCRIEKRARQMLWLAASATLITLIGSYIMMPIWHLTGVGIAVLVGQLVPALWTSTQVLRRPDIRTD